MRFQIQACSTKEMGICHHQGCELMALHHFSNVATGRTASGCMVHKAWAVRHVNTGDAYFAEEYLQPLDGLDHLRRLSRSSRRIR